MHLSYLLDTLEMAQRLVSAGASHDLIDPYAIPHAFQNQSQTKPDPAFIFAHLESRLSIREGRRSFRRCRSMSIRSISSWARPSDYTCPR